MTGGLDDLGTDLLAELVGSVRDAVVIWRSPRPDDFGAGEVVYVNDAFVRLSGYARDDLLGLGPGFMVGSGTDPEAVGRLLRSLHQGGRVVEELEMQRKDGEPIWVELTGFVHSGPDADAWFCGLYRDVTDRARAFERLETSREWARALIDGSADIIMVTDAEGVISYVSPAVERVLGTDPEVLVGSSCRDLVHPDERGRLDDDWQDLFGGDGGYLPAQYRVVDPDGGWRHVSVSARNMIDHPAVRGIVIHARDVTEQAEAEERLRQSEEWAQAMVQGGFEVVAVSDDQGVIRYVSPAVLDVLGYEANDFVGTDGFDYVHPDDAELARRVFDNEVRHDGSHSPTRVRMRHADGRWIQMSLLFRNMLDHPSVEGVVINGRDITDRWLAEQLLGQQAQAVEAIARGAPLDTTLYGIARMIEENIEGTEVALAVLGSGGQVRVRAAPSLDRVAVVALDRISPDSELADDLAAFSGLEVIPRVGDDGRWATVVDNAPGLLLRGVWCDLVTAPGTKEPLGALFVFVDEAREPSEADRQLIERLLNIAAIAIERRNFESTLEYQALHDDLTGLPNRTLMLDRIAEALARARRHGHGLGLLFIDLDRFKVINDSLGHAVGDQLLVQVAERFQRPLRLGDALGRFGGDEFLVLCDRLTEDDDAVRLAGRLADELRAPFVLGDSEIFVTASMGLAVTGEVPVSAEALIRNADMAMYQAKDAGRARHAVFEEDLHIRMLERHDLEQALRASLEEEDFELHYQPLIRLADGATTGVEALVRWNRSGRDVVEPAAFIPVAEETGLIVPLGEWIIESACRQAAAWPTLPDGTRLRMTVNLSARQLAQPNLIDHIARQIATHELDPSRLCFEITESVLMDDVARAIETIEAIKSLGVLIAIDDFGTGYATLDYLRRFSMADFLKIDQSFVEGVDRGGSKEMAIVAGAVSLAKSLGFTVVAEGVQTEGQLAALRSLDCDLGQGYFFSRPLPADAAVALLASAPHW